MGKTWSNKKPKEDLEKEGSSQRRIRKERRKRKRRKRKRAERRTKNL